MEGKAEKKFQDFGRKVDKMMADLNELKENLKNKYGDRLDEINKNKDKLEDEFTQFKEKNKDKIDEAEKNLENAGREIKKAFEAIFAKKPKEKDPASPPQSESSEH